MPNFKYDGFTEVVMKSQKEPLSGQKNRSSGNYLFTGEAFVPCSKVKWSCPSGISFNKILARNPPLLNELVSESGG